MSLKLILVFALIPQGFSKEQYFRDDQEILEVLLKKFGNVRIELREGVKSDFENIYVNYLLRQTISPIIVSTYSLEKCQLCQGYGDAFAIVTDMDNLNETVKYFSQSSKTFFYLLIGTINSTTIEEIFRNMWNTRKIFRTLIFATNTNTVMFYNPFSFQKNIQKFGSIMPFVWESIERIFDDINGYPLRIQMFKSVYSRPVLENGTNKIIDVEGADAEILQVLRKKMNFSMILQEPTKDYFGERQPNGTYNGAIGMLANDESDICFTGFFVKDYKASIDFTVTVYDDQLCCYVPKAPRIPQSIVPICAVRFDFWIAFILMGFAFGTIWAILRQVNLAIRPINYKKFNISKQTKYQILRIYVDTCVIWVRSTIVRYPPFYSEKILIISICLLSVILGAVIESSLATVYIHPMYYQDINTLQALDQSGLAIIYKFKSFKDDLFFSETSPLFASLNTKLIFNSDLESDLVEDMGSVGGFASVTRYSSLMLESRHYIMAQKVHLIEECPKRYMIAYGVPKNSPFVQRINTLLLRLLNSGLIDKWIKDMEFKVIRETVKMKMFLEKSIKKVLTLNDLVLAFYVLIVGSLLSVVALAAEVYWYKKQSITLLKVSRN